MKTTTAAVGLLIAMAAGVTQAENWYLGASVGLMDNNVSGYDDATSLGALLGYDVYTHGIAALSLEGVLTTTVAKGDISHAGSHGNWDIDTQAAYIAMRLGDSFYMKVRYGLLREDVSANWSGTSRSGSDTSGCGRMDADAEMGHTAGRHDGGLGC
jgi:hypothetical protein